MIGITADQRIIVYKQIPQVLRTFYDGFIKISIATLNSFLSK